MRVIMISKAQETYLQVFLLKTKSTGQNKVRSDYLIKHFINKIFEKGVRLF